MLLHWIWLAERGITCRAKNALLASFGSPEAVFAAGEEALRSIPKLSDAGMASLLDKDLTPAREILGQCSEKQIHVLTQQDAAYPARLRSLSDAPVVLYYRGTWPDLEDMAAFAVVGTRHPSAAGERLARDLGVQLAQAGAVVVSGLAAGVDGAAMEGALSAGGQVIGVVGCGADVVYPAENRSLFDRTAAHGCILSEYKPGTVPSRWHFPQRNRIVSALSLGVAVGETPAKSGALITADLARKQGKEIYVLPCGEDPGFAGCRALLSGGARLITHARDMLEEYRGAYEHRLHPENGISGAKIAENPIVEVPKDKKTIDKPGCGPYIDLNALFQELSPEEQKIASAIGEREISVDDLCEALDMPAGLLLPKLTMLQIKGVVCRRSGGCVTLRRS